LVDDMKFQGQNLSLTHRQDQGRSLSAKTTVSLKVPPTHQWCHWPIWVGDATAGSLRWKLNHSNI